MPAGDPSVGLIGRVTGRIKSGVTGEVELPFKGGTMRYHAFAADPTSEIPVGARVLVVEFRPPITVLVDPLPHYLAGSTPESSPPGSSPPA
jgi:hypothetical protein